MRRDLTSNTSSSSSSSSDELDCSGISSNLPLTNPLPRKWIRNRQAKWKNPSQLNLCIRKREGLTSWDWDGVCNGLGVTLGHWKRVHMSKSTSKRGKCNWPRFELLMPSRLSRHYCNTEPLNILKQFYKVFWKMRYAYNRNNQSWWVMNPNWYTIICH